jgi:hypothetical protein
MAYAFASELKDGYLHVRVRGPNDAATIRRYIKDTLASALRHSCPNVLVEENLEGAQISMGDVFQIVSDASANAKHDIHRIAFVDTNPKHTHANMKFAETVAVNRGMGMTVFATVADAEKWMRAQVEEPKPKKPPGR